MTYTPEEREVALARLTPDTWTPHERLGPVIWLSRAIDLQCDLTRTQQQLAEARSVIDRIVKLNYLLPKTLEASIDAFLEATR